MFRVQSLYLLVSSAINFFILAIIIYNDYQDDLMNICRGVTSASGSLLLYLIFQHKKKKLQHKIISIFSANELFTRKIHAYKRLKIFLYL